MEKSDTRCPVCGKVGKPHPRTLTGDCPPCHEATIRFRRQRSINISVNKPIPFVLSDDWVGRCP